MDQRKNNPIAIVSIIVLVLVVAYFGYGQYSKGMSRSAVVDTTVATTTDTIPARGDSSSSGTGAALNAAYKDGTYTAVGDYYSPGGAEQIKVSLTLKDDVVTDVVVTPLATRSESKMYQGRVASNIKSYVVGKKLDLVSVTKVSGSSLTPKGFMDAISKIKTDAAA